ncbi:hypothetical protein C0581_02680 [Candidatus Parcubacteria bacterium]|nr:MAG: hypothetical protein C0581_02680 [Candidatus Parcubacteria bacterium]
MEVPKKISAWMGIPCLAVSSVMSVGFWPPHLRYWFFILIGRREDEKKFGSGGGTAGSVVAQFVAWGLVIWGSLFWLLIITAISAGLGHLCIGKAEAYLRYRTWKRTGHTYRLNHKGEKVTHDFNETCDDEFPSVLFANMQIFFIDGPLWVKLLAGLFVLIAFRILDGKRKLGLAKWADGKTGVWACMVDDYFVALQVSCIISIPTMLWCTVNGRPVFALVSTLMYLFGIASFILPMIVRELHRTR